MPNLNSKCPPYPAVFALDQAFDKIRSAVANEANLSFRVAEGMGD